VLRGVAWSAQAHGPGVNGAPARAGVWQGRPREEGGGKEGERRKKGKEKKEKKKKEKREKRKERKNGKRGEKKLRKVLEG
jgi:hypothetical protein